MVGIAASDCYSKLTDITAHANRFVGPTDEAVYAELTKTK